MKPMKSAKRPNFYFDEGDDSSQTRQGRVGVAWRGPWVLCVGLFMA